MWCSTIGIIVTLSLSILAAPLVTAAQPAGKMYRIGLLNMSSATVNARPFEVFTQALGALDYIEGQNIVIERRYADGRPERLPALAAELATLHVDVFVVTNNQTAEVVQQITTTLPIVMTTAQEPVASGLVKSLARPGSAWRPSMATAGPAAVGAQSGAGARMYAPCCPGGPSGPRASPRGSTPLTHGAAPPGRSKKWP